MGKLKGTRGSAWTKAASVDGTTLRIAERGDYRRLAAWLADLSQTPSQHCLHTWSGQSAEDLHQQLLSFWDDGELCSILADHAGGLVKAQQQAISGLPGVAGIA